MRNAFAPTPIASAAAAIAATIRVHRETILGGPLLRSRLQRWRHQMHIDETQTALEEEVRVDRMTTVANSQRADSPVTPLRRMTPRMWIDAAHRPQRRTGSDPLRGLLSETCRPDIIDVVSVIEPNPSFEGCPVHPRGRDDSVRTAQQMPHVRGTEPHIDAGNAAAGENARTSCRGNRQKDSA